jgi:hypothetical protein
MSCARKEDYVIPSYVGIKKIPSRHAVRLSLAQDKVLGQHLNFVQGF